jgi:hypothetical protein
MKNIIISVITCILIGLFSYLYFENNQLNIALGRLKKEDNKINQTRQNLTNYETMKSKLSFCPMNNNSFIFQDIDFVWTDLDFNELIYRLSGLYRYDRVALITAFEVSQEAVDNKNEKKDQKFFKVKGLVLSPCR